MVSNSVHSTRMCFPTQPYGRLTLFYKPQSFFFFCAIKKHFSLKWSALKATEENWISGWNFTLLKHRLELTLFAQCCWWTFRWCFKIFSARFLFFLFLLLLLSLLHGFAFCSAVQFGLFNNFSVGCYHQKNKAALSSFGSSFMQPSFFSSTLFANCFSHEKSASTKTKEKLSSETFTTWWRNFKNNKVHIHYQAHYAQHFRNDFSSSFFLPTTLSSTSLHGN